MLFLFVLLSSILHKPECARTLGPLRSFLQVTKSLDMTVPLKALKQVKPLFSCGPDGIPSAILKAFGDLFVLVLTCIILTSLKTSKFPTCWKTGLVVPIFRSRSKLDPVNYRLISILCTASKLLEAVLCSTTYTTHIQCKNRIVTSAAELCSWEIDYHQPCQFYAACLEGCAGERKTRCHLF